jgi:hypothetical protein
MGTPPSPVDALIERDNLWVANFCFTNDIKELVVAAFRKQYYSRSK